MVKIPLVPQWNLNSSCICTPDGGFLYVGFRTINFISSTEGEDGTPTIHCFHTRQGILSLDVDPNWGQKECAGDDSNKDFSGNFAENLKQKISTKLFVALLEDNSVQIWDFKKGCAIQGHKAHLGHMHYMGGNGPLPQHVGEVLISYMCNRNVLSVDNQDIVVYCVASNSFYRRPIFIPSRNHQMTSLKCSPYNENHFAVGTKRGLVLLCDLQKMAIIYTLRGHGTSITALAWNRVDSSHYINIVAEKTEDCITTRKQEPKIGKLTRSDATIDSDDIFDIYDYHYLDNEFGAPSQNVKLKNDFVTDFVDIKTKETSTAAKFDFAEACQNLKEEINALNDGQLPISPENAISLEECKRAANSRSDLSSCSNSDANVSGKQMDNLSDKESSRGSLERLSYRTPSSEDSVDVDGMHRNQKQNIICQADVHQTNVYEDTNQLQSNENMEFHLIEDDVKTVSVIGPSVAEKEKGEEINCSKSKFYDILLASSSVDGTFCVWNSLTGATCHTNKPRSTQAGKNNRVEISWISPSSIVINNKSGELQLWSLQPLGSNQQPLQSGFRPYRFKETKRSWSQRSVVSFACSPQKQLIWTISSHRKICMEDFKLNKVQINYSCVSTNIGAMQECPDDMNKIALGFSDHRIGIIDISKMTPTSINIENFVQQIESSVRSLAWSPDCKKLAYGTTEGRIGVINIEGTNKQPLTFNSICGKPIYSINWQDHFLYVVCIDRIAVYEDTPNQKRDPYVIPDIGNVACIALRNSYLFVGTQNGQLRFYSRTGDECIRYELKSTFDLASRYISEISWSPIAANKLAVVANSNSIHILEFNVETAELKITRKIEISSPKAANSFVKWSNRNENYLLTCGFDGAVRVWDLSNDKCPERFVKTYHCPMTCGLFLPTDEDIIICSGKSAALEFIDMRVEKTERKSGKSKHSKPRTLDTVQWATKAVTCNDIKSQAVNRKRLTKSFENNVAELLESKMVVDAKVNNGVIVNEDVSSMLEKLHLQKTDGSPNVSSIYMKIPLTLLFLTTKEINKDALDIMFSILNTPKSNENKSLCAKLFGTKAEAREVLAEEMKNHQKSVTKGIYSLVIPQLNGNLKDEILRCVQSKTLCEWHVSLAPSISYSFWQKCCQAYAEQLAEQGYVMQAAAFLLAIHQQQDAIEMLIERKYFKEAFLIARIYLQQEDPLNSTISEQWITHLYNNGNLTSAALLCLLTKQNNRAYEFLAKIRNNHPEIERVIRLLKSSDV